MRWGRWSGDIKTYNGDIDYQGAYHNDKKEGQGKYTWSNGDWYEGEWKAGLRHGHGIYVWKDKNEKYDSWRFGLYRVTTHLPFLDIFLS